jgi:hypothetical protein
MVDKGGARIGQAQIGLTSGKIRMMVLLFDVVSAKNLNLTRMERYLLTVELWHELLANRTAICKGGD